MNQTRVIDIEAMRSPRRETPQISFRRTDQDRRPARVVRRPNDGPGDMSVRNQIARDLLKAAERKRIVVERPMTDAEKARARRHGRKMALLAMAAEYRFGLLVRDSVEPLGITPDLASILANELEFEGFVTRDVSGKPGKGRSLTITITDSGRDLLEGGEL